MNIGQIITRGLNRAGLSVSDFGMRTMAGEILDEIIQDLWESKHWQFRKRALTLSTTASTEEVALDRRVRVQNIVPNSMRGSDPVRRIRYEPSHDFYKRRPYQLETADPYYFRDGSFQGYSQNPSSASAITFVSSLTNYSTGTISVVKGQKRMIISTGVVSVDRIGQYIRIGSDNKAYKITGIDYQSTAIFYVNDPYEGADNASASFVIGDIGQKVSVLGYVSGQLQEEELLLNGSSSVTTSKSFTSLVRISKSDKTHGYITATSNSGGVTNSILDPGDTDLDVQTIKLYPVPSKTETINYEAYITHPFLYKPSDSPLFPREFHQLLVIDLFIRLKTEWSQQPVDAITITRRDEMLQSLITQDNNTDQWLVQVENYEESDRARINNLPTAFENDGFY